MTSIKGTGKIINIQCKTSQLPEFPDLLFGETTDGSRLFDATFFISKQAPSQKLTVEDFFDKFDFQIKTLADAYKTPAEKLVFINREGHQLIDGCLCYLFLSYVVPQFCMYVNEAIDEMLTTGIVVSDTYLIASVQKRFPPELRKTLLVDGNNEMA